MKSMKFAATHWLIIATLCASNLLFGMEGERQYGPLRIQDIYHYKQTLGFGSKPGKKPGETIQVVSGQLRFPDGMVMDVNDMPFGQFKKLIGLNQMYLLSDELPAGEEKLVEEQNERIPADTDTVKLHEKLDILQHQLRDLYNKKTRAAESRYGTYATDDKYILLIPRLNAIVSEYLNVNGSRDEIVYQLARALSLYVFALEGLESFNHSLNFLDRENNFKNYLGQKGIDVAPWFEYMRSISPNAAKAAAE